jgi:hypothetical protein
MRAKTTVGVALAAALLAAGCGSGAGSSSHASATKPVNPNGREVNPPGDIPDNQAFVRFAPAGAPFSVKVPEGWSRTGGGSRVTFAANLNSITVEYRRAAGAVTAASARRSDVAALARSAKRFKLESIGVVRRNPGTAVRIRYLALGKPDALTGKVRLDAAERYLFMHGGTEVVLTLAGPKGADNVDPWRTVTDSLAWKT